MKTLLIVCLIFATSVMSNKTPHQEKILMNIMEEIFNEPEFQSLKLNQQLEFSLSIYNILQSHFKVKESNPVHKKRTHQKRGFYHLF
jgi:hypothetical protein